LAAQALITPLVADLAVVALMVAAALLARRELQPLRLAALVERIQQERVAALVGPQQDLEGSVVAGPMVAVAVAVVALPQLVQ
jgi:hypothetical protein